MAPVRQTRSRGTATLAAGLPDTTKATPETPTTSKPSKKSPPKGKKSTKPSTRRTRLSTAISNGVASPNASESSNEEDEGENADDAEDECAPPSTNDNNDDQADDATADSTPVKTSVEVNDQSWVGPPSKSTETSQASNELAPDAIGFGEDFESEGEGNAEEEEEDDFDIADDDDNYDDVDKISDTSDASDAFEREVEREIMADGEDGIDWDDVNTYRYDNAPTVNQYSMAIDLALEQDSPLHPEFSYFEELRSPNVASPTLSRDLSHQFGAALHSHRRRHTFSSLANSDSSSSSSSSSGAEQANEDGSASSNSSSLDDDGSDDDGATTDEDEDPSDYEAVRPRVTPVIATPPTWIPNFPSLTSGSRNGRVANRSSRSGITRRRSTSNPQAHSLVLRKLRLPSHKAIVQHVRTARGWTVRFELRGGHSLRWLSSPNSAASTPITTARNSFDLETTTERYVSRAGFDDVLQGRLFQHRYCTPRAPPQHRTTNFSRGYDLFTANSYWTPLMVDQSSFSHPEPASPIFDPDNEIEDLIDMSAFEDENASDRGATPVPSDFKHPGNATKTNGKVLGEPFDETSANSANYSTSSTRPSTSQSSAGDGLSDIPATPSATPRKRRASETPDHTELTPIFKRHSVRHSREVLI